jgi:hypothetical protein
MEGDLKEVIFEKYCPKCKEWDTDDWVDPCCECLCEGFRIGTEVPLHYDGPKLVKETSGTRKKLGL